MMSWILIFTLALVSILLIEIVFLILEQRKDKKEARMQAVREEYDINLKRIQEEKVYPTSGDVLMDKDSGNLSLLSNNDYGGFTIHSEYGGWAVTYDYKYINEYYENLGAL